MKEKSTNLPVNIRMKKYNTTRWTRREQGKKRASTHSHSSSIVQHTKYQNVVNCFLFAFFLMFDLFATVCWWVSSLFLSVSLDSLNNHNASSLSLWRFFSLEASIHSSESFFPRVQFANRFLRIRKRNKEKKAATHFYYNKLFNY